MLKFIFALLFVSSALAVTPNFGEYVLTGLKVVKSIFSHSSVTFDVLKFEELDSGGNTVRSVDTSTFSTFSDWTLTTQGNGTDIFSSDSTFSTSDDGTGSLELEAIYATSAVNVTVGPSTVTIPSNSIKTAYLLAWPTESTNGQFRLTASASWHFDARDTLDILKTPSYKFVYDTDGTTKIGVHITDPFDMTVYFPRHVFVGSTAVSLDFSGSVDVSSATLVITIPAMGPTITIDPIISIFSAGNWLSYSMMLISAMVVFLLF